MPQASETLFDTLPDIKDEAKDGLDPLVSDFLNVYQDFREANQEWIQEKDDLNEDLDKVADLDDPSVSNKRTNTSMGHKMLYKTLKQLDIPSFKMIASGPSPARRALVQSLLEDALEKMGWRRVLTNKKNGAQKECFGTGDTMIGFGSNPDGKFPLAYWNMNIAKIGMNTDATLIVNPGGERSARKFVFTKEYAETQAMASWPVLIGNALGGAIPQLNDQGEIEQKLTEEQQLVADENKVEIAYAYDLDFVHTDGQRGLFMMFAGATAFPFKDLRGAAFPFRDRDGNPEIPGDQLIAFARSKGFYNYGVLQIVWKLGEMHRTLMNMGITYTLSNSNPIRIVATSMSETEFANGMARAQQRSKDGKMPIMVNKDGKEFGGVTPLQTQPIIAEMNGILERIEQDLQQMGFNINDIATDSTKTLGALQLEVAASTDLVRYLQKENAPSYERLIQMAITALVNRKKDDSDIKLVSNAKARNKAGKDVEIAGVPEVDERNRAKLTPGGETKVGRSFSLEDLKQDLREFEWDVEVSGGVVNNPVLEDQVLRDIIATSDPTSKASTIAKSIRAKNAGHNLEASDFVPNSALPPEPAAAPGAATPKPPTGTTQPIPFEGI